MFLSYFPALCQARAKESLLINFMICVLGMPAYLGLMLPLCINSCGKMI